MATSTYSGNEMLDHVFRNSAWTAPTNVYVSFHTADPGLTGANEVSAGWYSRQVASFASATTSGVATNAAVTWTAVSGGAVTVTHIGLWDASTAGNFLWGLDVTDKLYNNGDTPRIASGNITITIDAAISNYLIPRILDHLVGNATYTAPATVYASLYTSDPTAADSGTEVSGTGYSRVAVTFDAAASRAIDISSEVDFGTVGSGGWGTVAYFGIHDASTAGNLLVFGAVTGGGAISGGDTVVISSGEFDIAWN